MALTPAAFESARCFYCMRADTHERKPLIEIDQPLSNFLTFRKMTSYLGEGTLTNLEVIRLHTISCELSS